MGIFTDFETTTPEAMGISSNNLIDFLRSLENARLPMHSAIVMRHGKIIFESYYEPYNRNSLHRMFSITKSFVSLAIGLLCEENKLSLNDHIIDYFPEKLPSGGVHPYIAAMTIQDMLRMATAHDKTTFKQIECDDWVKTFFTVTPTHVPGTCFSYDTSSAHTLTALVEKLSGMELLDYLRVKFLDDLDFSKDAYCLKDPMGVSMGGSGLMCTPYDLLKVMYVISNNGKYKNKQLLPAQYIKAATSKQIDTYAFGSAFEEMQGYGYQFWRTTHNGFVCFGMAGQLALYIPDKDIILITTADAMGRQGGVQLIYDSFWTNIYEKISDDNTENISLPADTIAYNSMLRYASSRKLDCIKAVGYNNDIASKLYNGKTFVLDKNPMGFSKIKLSFGDCNGTLEYTNQIGVHILGFGLNRNLIQNFPYYNQRCAVSGAWQSNDTFLIKAQIIDEDIGNVYFQLVFKDDTVTLTMRKFKETAYEEFNGFTSGVMLATQNEF